MTAIVLILVIISATAYAGIVWFLYSFFSDWARDIAERQRAQEKDLRQKRIRELTKKAKTQ